MGPTTWLGGKINEAEFKYQREGPEDPSSFTPLITTNTHVRTPPLSHVPTLFFKNSKSLSLSVSPLFLYISVSLSYIFGFTQTRRSREREPPYSHLHLFIHIHQKENYKKNIFFDLKKKIKYQRSLSLWWDWHFVASIVSERDWPSVAQNLRSLEILREGSDRDLSWVF